MKKPLIKYSKRKTLAITVNDNGDILVRAPLNTCVKYIEDFVMSHQDWILKYQDIQRAKNRKVNLLSFDKSKIDNYKDTLTSKVLNIVNKYEKLLDIKIKSIKLSNAKKRWGSCTVRKEVKINWRLYFVPDSVLEYVVLHELAHIVHLNHSKSFWRYISIFMPDFKERKKQLRSYDYLLLI